MCFVKLIPIPIKLGENGSWVKANTIAHLSLFGILRQFDWCNEGKDDSSPNIEHLHTYTKTVSRDNHHQQNIEIDAQTPNTVYLSPNYSRLIGMDVANVPIVIDIEARTTNDINTGAGNNQAHQVQTAYRQKVCFSEWYQQMLHTHFFIQMCDEY